MPTIRKQSIDDRLFNARIAIENVFDPNLLVDLEKYGYNAARLQHGRALYEEALPLQHYQHARRGDQCAAKDVVATAWKQADANYKHLLALARIAFDNEPGTAHRLALTGRRERSLGGWLMQVRQLYGALLADPALAARMAQFSITTAKLEAGQAQADAVEQADQVQEQARGAAQDAIKARNAALNTLTKWMADFTAIAHIALQARPYMLGMLGLRARSKASAKLRRR